MAVVRVAILGASGWMGKVHTMACQTFPHFLGTIWGSAKVAALVEKLPDTDPDLASRAPEARTLQSWPDAVQDPEIDLIDICLPDNPHHEVAKAAMSGTEDWSDVTNPDGSNMLCRFANGARGVIDFSRIATGRKFMQTYEVYGTKGRLAYTYDEVNRLQFYSNADATGRRGFREIDVGPENETFRAFLPLPNFSLGYYESRIIKAAEVIRSITTGQAMWPSFETGYHICQIVDACMESSRLGRWVSIE